MPANFDLSSIDGLMEELSERAGRMERLVGSERTKRIFKQGIGIITKDAKARLQVIMNETYNRQMMKDRKSYGPPKPPEQRTKLKNAIETTVTVKPDEPTVIEVGISYKRHRLARHAHLVEGGHGGNAAPPHPFWKPAVEAHYKEVLEFLEDEMNDLIDEAFS